MVWLVRPLGLVLFAWVAALPAVQAASLIKGGSFESPLVPPGGFTTWTTGQTFAKWTVVGAPGGVSIVSGAFSSNGIAFPAKAGQQWLDLTGPNSNQPTGVNQTVKTVPGTAYRLKFSVGNVVDTGGPYGVSSAVDVQVDGVTLMTAVHTGGGSSELSWKGFSLTFTATANKTRIAFINADATTDNSNGLDGISLTAVAAGIR